MEKIAVVVVHGIGYGTGEQRCEFSKSLKENVKALLPDGENLVWEEANWEELNDDIDAIVKRVFRGLCNSQTRLQGALQSLCRCDKESH